MKLNIHDILEIKLDRILLPHILYLGGCRILKGEENEDRFLTRLTIARGELRIDEKSFYQFLPNFYVRDKSNCVYYKSVPIPRFKLKMSLEKLDKLNTKIVINPLYDSLGNSRLAGYPPWSHIRDVIAIKLLQNGHLLLHSACISKNGKAFLLCGLPDTGKTLTSILASRCRGFKFMSDDLTVVNSKFAFSVLSARPLTREFARICNYKFTPKEYIKSVLCDFSRETIRKTKNLFGIDRHMLIGWVKMQDLFEKLGISIQQKAPINMVCILKKGQDQTKKLPPREALKKLLFLNRLEFSYLHNPLLLAYDWANGNFDLQILMKKEEGILRRITQNVPVFEISCNRSIDYVRKLEKIAR